MAKVKKGLYAVLNSFTMKLFAIGIGHHQLRLDFSWVAFTLHLNRIRRSCDLSIRLEHHRTWYNGFEDFLGTMPLNTFGGTIFQISVLMPSSFTVPVSTLSEPGE